MQWPMSRTHDSYTYILAAGLVAESTRGIWNYVLCRLCSSDSFVAWRGRWGQLLGLLGEALGAWRTHGDRGWLFVNSCCAFPGRLRRPKNDLADGASMAWKADEAFAFLAPPMLGNLRRISQAVKVGSMCRISGVYSRAQRLVNHGRRVPHTCPAVWDKLVFLVGYLRQTHPRRLFDDYLDLIPV